MRLSKAAPVVKSLEERPASPEKSDPPPPCGYHSQLALNLSPNDHFTALHGKHQHSVAYATITADKTFRQQVLQHQDAKFYAPQAASETELNTYISQAGFLGSRRAVHSVAVLPSMFVDLDHYNIPALKDLNSSELVNHILQAERWLPTPTFIADSGRGAYLQWVFTDPLMNNKLPRWQTSMACLVDLLEPYGADPKAKDAARVLRLAWSTHTGTGSQVQYDQLGSEVKFTDMEKIIKANHESTFPKLTATPQTKRKPLTGQVSRSNVKSLFNTHTLHWGRMQDIQKLAELRAPLTDYRYRMIYHLAVSAAWFCPSVESLQQEVNSLAETYFQDPTRYTDPRKLKTITGNMMKGKDGKKTPWKGKEVDYRYRVKTATIIKDLDITPEEQRHMMILIDSTEKYRRKKAKRRAAGQLARDKWLAKIRQEKQERQQLAMELRQKGEPNKTIAETLGLNPRSVRRLING